MKTSLKTMACAGLTGLLLAGCQADDLYNPELVVQNYEASWKETFGEIDPNQTWNMAKQVTANIALNQATQVNIYTGNPSTPGSKVLARAAMNSNIRFDAHNALAYVFVEALQGDKLLTNGYFPINGNTVNVSKGAQTRAIEGNPASVGKDETISETTFYYLTDVETEKANPWKVGDFRHILGEGGYFEEGVNNVKKYVDTNILSKDVIYTVNKDNGEVEMTLSYSCTSAQNKFGYFYYTGDTPSDASAVKKYILIDNTTNKVEKYYYYNEWSSGWQAVYSNDNLKNTTGNDDDLLRGTTYKLTYFGEDGNATGTYAFPQGTKIGFFIINGTEIMYSIADLNTNKDVYAATYQYGSTTMLGFEDWSNIWNSSDQDLNDLLFFATGDFDKPESITPDPEPEPGEGDDENEDVPMWILACEDLGNIGDFDFNDIVLGIQHVSGETTATVTPLAVGGSLPAHIYYGSQDLGEIHALFGLDSTEEFANTERNDNKTAQTLSITVPSDFSVATSNWGGFKIVVTHRDGKTTNNITPPGAGDAPQMICVPEDWLWPVERTNIKDAYPDFSKWVSDGTNTDWYENVVSSKVIAR